MAARPSSQAAKWVLHGYGNGTACGVADDHEIADDWLGEEARSSEVAGLGAWWAPVGVDDGSAACGRGDMRTTALFEPSHW